MAQVLTLCRSVLHWNPLWVRSMCSLEEQGRAIFAAAVEGVQPDSVVRRALQRRGDELVVAGHSFKLHHNLHLVGFGKAVLGMAAEAERIVGDHLVQGIVSVPHGIQETLQRHRKLNMLLDTSSKIKVMEGAKHNLPDTDAQRSAESIRELASSLTDGDLLLVLISGGGSALLPAPVPPITLQEKQEVTRCLAAAGATIQELNTVRRALSLLKGGGLSRCAYPAQVVGLILSDIIGDPVDLIASGPTVWSETSLEEVWAILYRYNLYATLPLSVQEVLNQTGSQQRSKLKDQPQQDNILNAVIGSNAIALECASRKAQELGLRPVILSPGVCGNVQAVAQLYGLLSRFACSPGKEPPELRDQILKLGQEVGVGSSELCRTMKHLEEGWQESLHATCLLAGGEPTVQLLGKGKGGRNQELALRVGLELSRAEERSTTVFLSGGTDGQDGPTEAAGAVSDRNIETEAQSQGLDIDVFLRNNDSFTFFSSLSKGQKLLLPGLTGTNVMDVHLMILPPPPSAV
ncbi:glycerate kinase [Pangasianodon hypophthalmus]|uniref:glycerate kinase n=1 Tax=Pangasianodon hypophthalmus TaxID=310915 RepID=UPI002307E297|nr:glycerate kinase [Pangasianodon hypophthalmus]